MNLTLTLLSMLDVAISTLLQMASAITAISIRAVSVVTSFTIAWFHYTVPACPSNRPPSGHRSNYNWQAPDRRGRWNDQTGIRR